MPEPRPGEERLWERGWEGHDRAQAARLAKLPLSAKLDWLEQAQVLVRKLASARSPGESSPRE